MRHPIVSPWPFSAEPARDTAAPGTPRRLRVRASGGFTLVELLVVIAIIAIVAALAAPSIGPLMRSNQLTEAVNTLNGLMTSAQTAAEANVTPVALRIERAYEMVTAVVPGDPDAVKYSQMRKTGTGEARWLPYQQARLCLYATKRPDAASSDEAVAFRQIPGSKITQLPENAWLAPLNAIQSSSNFGALTSNDLWYQPNDITTAPTYSQYSSTLVSRFNRLDTFYIVFSRTGGVSTMNVTPGVAAAAKATHYWYLDETQPYWDGTLNKVLSRFIDHPDDSARGVIIYDRKEFESLADDDATRREYLRRSRSVYVNRSLGSGVEGRVQ